jgi:superfamily II DNA or RNA helicase
VPGASIGTIRASDKENRGAPVQVASIQTLVRRELPPADLVFIDEAHHAAAGSYRKILDAYPEALVFGLTATPYRLDGKPLGDLFEDIVESTKASELIEAGWLSRPRVWTVPVDERPDLSGVKMSGGDFNIGELDKVSRRKNLVGNIVDHWKRLAENRPTVCYAVSVKHGQQIRDAFKSAGINSELLTGETKDELRSAMLRRLASGESKIIVNCMVLTEGWDCQEARCAIIARPTMSLALWFQMCGRVMRKGDVDPIILDHAGNALMHQLPGSNIVHSLTEAQPKTRKPGQAKEKVCGDCGSSMPIGCRVCPNCGHVFWIGEPPEEIVGELEELSRDRATFRYVSLNDGRLFFVGEIKNFNEEANYATAEYNNYTITNRKTDGTVSVSVVVNDVKYHVGCYGSFMSDAMAHEKGGAFIERNKLLEAKKEDAVDESKKDKAKTKVPDVNHSIRCGGRKRTGCVITTKSGKLQAVIPLFDGKRKRMPPFPIGTTVDEARCITRKWLARVVSEQIVSVQKQKNRPRR